MTFRCSNRRQFLSSFGGGLGSIALASMLADQGIAHGSELDDSSGGRDQKSPQTHSHGSIYPRKAKRVVQLFMAGAASHIDLWDFKPELIKRHGEPSDFGEPVEAFQDGLGPWKKPIWNFRPCGQSGKLLSEVVMDLAPCVDEMAFVHNMVGKSGVHSTATLLQATGFGLPGFPGMGCWISYGLGDENENLPTFVVLPDHRGFASNGVKNWDAAFLPSQHSGTVIRLQGANPIPDLLPDQRVLSWRQFDPQRESALRESLASLNRSHAEQHPLDETLESRIRNYELAARMQLAAPQALDFSDEPQYMLDQYGIAPDGRAWPEEINAEEEADAFGRKCLAARRLLERGVRFVQIWSGNDNGFPRRNWDSHENVERDHGPLARGMARGASALIRDLKHRGMLEETLILWTTEFGRMPSTQGGLGRDHNPYVFTNWLCGGGIRGGISYGPSDEFGYKPLDRSNPTQVYDIHATILKLLGFDHTKLTFRHSGIDRRLTDVHGRVIEELIA